MKEKIITIINNCSPELAAEEIIDLFSFSTRQREILLAFMGFYFSPKHKTANTTFAEDVDAFLDELAATKKEPTKKRF